MEEGRRRAYGEPYVYNNAKPLSLLSMRVYFGRGKSGIFDSREGGYRRRDYRHVATTGAVILTDRAYSFRV